MQGELRVLSSTATAAPRTITLVAGLLWYKFNENINPEMWLHAENVMQGQVSLSGDRTPGVLIRYARGLQPFGQLLFKQRTD